MDGHRVNRTPSTSVPPQASRGATPLSHVAAGRRLAARSTEAPARLARVSLYALALTMTSTGCIITDPPQFTPPKHTRPFLVEATATPDPKDILPVDQQLLGTTQSVLKFAADVVSQDDPSSTTTPTAFQQVEGRLYLDYGLNGTELTRPYRFALSATPILPSGTLEQTGRRISATWSPLQVPVSDGCHTVTLIVSHKFDDQSNCPVCSDDFSAITWQIARCDRSLGGCKDLPVSGKGSCQGLTNSCAQAQDALGTNAEPCSEFSDGGAP
jgi:hypothetical protein